jgi:hypothetical protein
MAVLSKNKIFSVEKKDLKKFEKLEKQNLKSQKKEPRFDFSKMRQIDKK